LAGGCAIPAFSYTDFALNLSLQNLQTYSMSAGHTSISIQVNNFGYGNVNLSVSGLPANVTASFNKSTVYNGIVTLTLSANKYAVNKTVPITIFGVSGSRVHPVTVNLHVVPA
jgi:hypothetical protein